MTTSPVRTMVAVLATIACLSACGPVPGGTLSGVVTRTPTNWAAVLEDGRSLCEIESRPTDSHSIQLDCFLYQDDVYVQSHRWALAAWWPVESWAAIWILEPMVRVRIGMQIFEMEALHISDPVERRLILEFCGYDPVPDGIAVFRFAPRS